MLALPASTQRIIFLFLSPRATDLQNISIICWNPLHLHRPHDVDERDTELNLPALLMNINLKDPKRNGRGSTHRCLNDLDFALWTLRLHLHLHTSMLRLHMIPFHLLRPSPRESIYHHLVHLLRIPHVIAHRMVQMPLSCRLMTLLHLLRPRIRRLLKNNPFLHPKTLELTRNSL